MCLAGVFAAAVAGAQTVSAEVTIATTATEATEGKSVAFTATRTGTAEMPLAVTVQATAPSQIGVPLYRLHRVAFAAGSSTAEFNLPVRAYSNYRTDAVFQVEVVAGTSYRVPADAEPIRLPIRDVDIPTVRIEPVLESVSENQQCALFQLVHSNTDGFIGSDGHFVDVVIDVTTEGEFLAGAARKTVRMLGATDGPTKTVCVALDDDTVDEAAGSVTATISLAEGGRFAQVASDGNAATVTVSDDDLPMVTLSTTATEVTEGESAQFTVTRAGVVDAALAIMVDYGAGVAPDTAYTVTFGAGAASGSFTLATQQDTKLSFDRRLSVVLRDAATWRVDGQASSVAIPIVDDDRAVASVSALSRSVTEGSGCAWFSLSVDNVEGLGESENAWVEVPLAITEQGSYLSGASTERVRMEQSSRNVCVALDDDTVVEADGSVTVTISPGVGAKVEAATGAATATVTVSDDDGTPPTNVAAGTVAIVSAPGDDETYGIGDEIELTATFSAVATVSGTPQVVLGLGTGTRVASYEGGSGSTTLTFSYTVETGDEDGDGISVAANGLQANGGTLSLAGGAAPRLTALAAQSGHKVDGVRPELEEWSDEQAKVAVVGETLLLEMRFSEAVSGLAVADFRVRNGTLSALLQEPVAVGADPTWTVLVTATAVGELVVELPAGVYQDAHGNTGAASAVYRKAARKPAVTITAVEAEIDEGETARFTLSRDIGVGSMTATVEVTETMGEPSTREVTFAEREGSEESTAVLEITTENDRLDEADGTISVGVLDGTGYTAGTPRTAKTRVTDDDRPTVVWIWRRHATRIEGQPIPFTVQRVGGSSAHPLIVHLRVRTTGDLFTGATSFGASLPAGNPSVADITVTIPAGVKTKNILFYTDDDSRYERRGSLTVALQRPVNAPYVTGQFHRDAVAVLDNDVLQAVSISTDQARITEGETAFFTLRRSDASRALRVDVGVLLAGDFVPASSPYGEPPPVRIPVTFAISQHAAVLAVPTVDDASDEGRGNITLFIHPDSTGGYLLGRPLRAEVSVDDNDGEEVTIATTATTATEGGTVSFTATRTGDAATQIKIAVRATTPNALGNSESTLAEAIFAAASSTAEFSLPVPAYSNYRTDAVFQVEVVAGVGATYRVPAGAQPIRLPIRDVDIATVRIEPVLESVSENQQCALFQLVHSNTDGFIGSDDHFVDVVIDVTTEGEFLAGAARKTVRMLGATDGPTKTVCVALDDDTVDEAAGSVTATISLAEGGRFAQVASDGNAATVTVSDDDLPMVTLSTTATEVTEGESAQFTVTRAGVVDAALAIMVDYGAGVAPDTAYTVTFGAGAASGSFTLATQQDTKLSFDRRLSVVLRDAATWRVDGQASSVAIPIVDDDRAVASVSALSRSVTEGSGCAWFSLSVDNVEGLGESENAWVEVPLAITEQGNYLSGASTQRVRMEQSSRNVCVPLDNDTVWEASGSVTVTISPGVGAKVEAATGAATATVTVSDDDGTPPTNVAAGTVAIVSAPGDDETYGIGDEIELTATFSAVATVSGTPQVVLGLGTGTRVASYEGGSGSTTLTFSYTVETGDEDGDGISVAANGLQANGGTLSLAGGAAPRLTALAAQSGHKVDGVRPELEEWSDGQAEVAVVGEPRVLVMRFSEAVSGLAVADFRVRSGTLSELLPCRCSGPPPAHQVGAPALDSTWTGLVTATAVGEVVVELPAGVYQDAHGNTGAASAVYRKAARKPAVTITAVEPTVEVGASATFRVTRDIGNRPISLVLQITEPRGTGPHMQVRTLGIPGSSAGQPGVLEVRVGVQSQATPGAYLRATIPTDDRYTTDVMREAVVWIEEAPATLVSLWKNHRNRIEGQDVEFTLRRAAASAPALTVRLRVTVTGGVLVGTTSFGATLTGSGDSYVEEVDATIPANTNAVRLLFDTVDDSDINPPGTVTVELLRAANAPYVTGQFYRDAVTVFDDDVAQSISITAVKAAITEGETASFTVQRSGGSAPQSVPVGVALEGDLVAAATTVSGVSVTDGATIPVRFEADETSVTVAVPTVADDMDEIDGAITLFVRAASDGSYRLGSPPRATAAVRDDDLPEVTVATTAVEAVEGAPVNAMATRVGDATVELTVSVRSTAPNERGESEVGHTGVTFPAGSSTAEFSLPVRAYSNYRTDAVFQVEVVAGVGATYRVPAGAQPIRLPIRDVDIPTVRIEPVLESVSENQQCALFQLVHSNTDGFIGSDDHFVDVVIDVTTEGEFVAGAARKTVRVLGATDGPTKTVCVALDDDTVDEAAGSVTATISLAEGGRFAQVASDGNAATVTVSDDDLPMVTLSTTATEVTEGESAQFTVTRAGVVDAALAIMVDHGAGVAPDTAYTVTFGAGAASGSFTLPTQQDTKLSFDRRLSVVLRDAATWRVDGQASSVAIPIVDDDRAVASVSALSRSVTEGSGCAWFSLSVDNVEGLGESENAWVEVPLAITERGSYLSGASTERVRMEQSSRNVCVALDDDAVVEANGSVTVTISPGVGAKVEAATGAATATVTVSDDELVTEINVAAGTVAIVSAPGDDETYGIGDEIELTATFSAVATVSGTPQVVLGLGTGTRVASYEGGSGSTTLTFSYTVETGDEDGDGISVAANGLQANGGTLSLAGGAAPRLTALAAQSGHKVDGVRPELEEWSDGQAEVAVVGETLLLVMRFSKAVSGLAVADFRVRSGTLSELLPCRCSGPPPAHQVGAPALDPTWTVLVTATAVGELVVELPAGVYQDAHGNTGAASAVYRKAARKPAVSITAIEAEIDEGETAQFTLSRDIGVGSIAVSVEVNDTMGEPYTRTVTFARSIKTAALEITTENDRVDEPDGTISVRVLDGTRYTAGTPRSTARTRVTDDDRPAVVSVRATYRQRTEGQSVRFTLSRSTASTLAGPLTVHLRVTVTGDVLAGTTSFGSSIPGNGAAHYVADVQATIPAGAKSEILSFDTDDDSEIDSPGTVTLEVLRPANAPYVTGASYRDAVTVRDTDVVQSVTIRATETAVLEGETAHFSIVRSGHRGRLTATVAVRLDGAFVDSTAVVRAARIPVNFGFGETSVSLTIPTVDDSVDESTGAITLWVEAASDGSYLLGRPSRAMVAVLDNDLPAVTIATTATEVTEGESVAFTATRVGVTLDSARFTVRATLPDRIGSPRTFLKQAVFREASSTAEFSLPVPAHSNYRTDAVFRVEVVAGTSYRVPADAEPIRLPIRDVDIPTVRIEPVLESVSENQQCALFRLVHSNTDGFIGSDGHFVDVVIDVTTEGEFLAGAARKTVRVLGGTDGPTKTVCVALDDDTVDEAAGSVTATISLAEGGRFAQVASDGNAATVTVSDDDLPMVTLSTTATEVTEGESAQFTVTRAGVVDAALAIMVDYGAGVAPGTAYTVTFGAGAASGSFTLATQQDTKLSFDRRLSVVLRDAATWRVDGQASSVAIPIVDDDRAVASVSALSRSVTEGSGCAWFSLSVDNVEGLGESENAWVEVPLAITEQGSYLSGASTERVRMEQSSRNVCVALDDDTVVEANGSVTVTISPGAGAKVEAATGAATATVTVSDDDGTPPANVAAGTVAIVSAPGDDETYGIGDEIELTATFSAVATVSGTPQVVLGLGTGTRVASYEGGSGSTTLTFSYTVETGDEDGDGISVAANGLQANGGTLSLAGGAAPRLTALAAQSGHKVDGVRPELEEWSDEQAKVAVVGETLLLEMRFSEAVSGLAVADFRVRNGTLSALLQEPVAVGADPTWTVLVTATAVGELVVELPAGVYQDAHGNTGAASAVYRKAARKPAVTITAVEAEIDEGETARFTLSRDIGVGSMTATAEVTETMGEPYTREVTFAEREGSEESTAVLEITTENDRLDEADGTISVGVLDGTGYTAGTPRTAKTRVTDDDRPTVVSIWTTYQRRNEGQRVPFTVFRLGGSTAQPLTVRLRVTVTGNMFTGTTSFGANVPHGGDVSVTIPAAKSLINVYFDTDNDLHFERSATITVEVLRPSNAGYVTGQLVRDTAEVLDNDLAAVVSITPAANAIREGETAQFTLRRSFDGGEQTVLVDVRLDGDFVASTAAISGQPVTHAARISVTFPAGDTSISMAVPTVDDGIVEADGAITLTIVEPIDDSYRLGRPVRASVSVRESPLSVVSVTTPVAEVTEGAAASFRLHRTGDLSVPLDVFVQVSGHRKIMATSTAALVPAVGTMDSRVVFTRGDATTTLDLATAADRISEGHGVLRVTLVDHPTYRVGGTRSGKILVRDDDEVTVTLQVPYVTTTLQGSTLVGAIPEGASISVEAVCSANVSDAVVVPITYEISREDRSSQAVTLLLCNQVADIGVIAVGVGNGKFETALSSWEVIGDRLRIQAGDRGGEGCSAANNYLYCRRFAIGAARAVRIDIINRQPVIAVEAEDYSIKSGSVARFKIRRIWTPGSLRPAGHTTEVAYRIRETGGYTDIAGERTVVFAADETEKTILVPTWELAAENENGQVVVEIRDDPSPSTAFGGSYEVVGFLPGVTPTGRSARRAVVSIERADLSLIEIEDADTVTEDAGNLDFKVTVSPPSATDLSGQWTTVDGTAIAGEDYEQSGGKFVIPAGSSELILRVAVLNDSTHERRVESMEVRLTSVSRGGAFLQGVTTIEAVGTIRDDDRGVVNVVARPDQIVEGDTARFKLTRIGYTGVTLRASVSWQPPYTGGDETVSVDWGRGVTQQIIGFTTVDNSTSSISMLPQYGQVQIVSLSGDDYTIGTGTASVLLLDDEGPVLAFADARLGPVEEGRDVQVGVTLSEVSSATVTVSVQTVELRSAALAAGVAATSGVDFTPYDHELTFAPGVTTQTVSIELLDDEVDETKERFGVRLRNSRNAAIETSVDTDPSLVTISIQDNDRHPVASIRRVGPAQVPENGGRAEFEISIDRPTERLSAPSVELEPSYRSIAQPIADFDFPRPLVLRFHSGEMVKTIVIDVVDDDIDEPDETWEMAISSSSPDIRIDDDNKVASTQIVDDDTRGITVVPTEIAIPDGGASSYSVVLESRPGSLTPSAPHVSVVVTPPAGLTAYPRRMRFTPDNWQTPQSFKFRSTLGALSVGTTVNISHTVRGGDYGTFDMDEVAVSVLRADHPVLGVDDATASESDAVVAFAVTMSGTATEQVTVGYASADRDAESGIDYTAVNGRLTFATDGSNRTQTIQVAIIDDSLDEGVAESFVVTLFDAENALLAGGVQASGTILDDEDPSISIGDASAREDDGSLVFAVSLSSAATESVAVQWATVASSAVAGDDFTAASDTLTFDPGEVGATVEVDLVDDTAQEPSETFTVSLAQATGPAVIGRATGIGTILPDDDYEPGIGLRIDQSSTTVVEGNPVTFTLARNLCNRCPAASLEAFAHPVDISVTGTFSTGTVPTEVAFAAGAQVATVVVTTVDDRVDEVDGSVTLTIPDNSARTGIRLLEASSHTARIIDNDMRGIAITPTPLVIEEGTTGTYGVILETEPTADVTVSLSLPDRASITAAPTSLTFNNENWEIRQAVTVTTTSDRDAEDEQVEVTHEVVGGDYGTLAPPSLTVRVVDTDTASTEIVLSVSPTTVTEAGGAQAVVGTARLDAALHKQDTTVRISVVPATAADADLASVVATVDVVIAAGSVESSATLTVTPAADHIDEDDEELAVTGRVVDAGTTVSVVATTLTITDDDTRGVTVSTDALAVTEGDATSYTLVLTSQPTGPVQVDVNVPSDTDVTASPQRLEFATANWNTAQTVTVRVQEDRDKDTDPEVVISHDVRGADYAGVTVADVTVTITDITTPTFTSRPVSVSESASTLQFEVELNVSSTDPLVSLDYTTANDSAVAGQDYTEVTGTLTFAAGSEETFPLVRLVSVPLTNDALDEADTETFVLVLENPVGAAFADGSQLRVVGTIADDDPTPMASAQGSSSQSTSAVGEASGHLQFQVVLSEPSALEASVGYATADPASSDLGAPATPTEDYASTSGVLTFAPGETRKTIQVTVVDDALDEPNEFLVFRLSEPRNAELGRQRLLGEIQDDDTRGITLSESEVTVEEGNATSVIAVLDTQPTAEVTIDLEVTGSTDVSVSPLSLTFSTAVWNQSQTVTVTAAPDLDALAERAAVRFTVGGGDYAALAVPQLPIVVTDDDEDSSVVELVVSPDRISERVGSDGAELVVTGSLDAASRLSSAVVTVWLEEGSTRARSSLRPVEPFKLTIPSGELTGTRTLTITPIDNRAHDGDRTVTVRARTRSPGLRVEISNPGIHIVDDDPEPLPFSVAENGTAAGTVAVTDATGYTITVGADGALFDVDRNSGALAFKSAPNYEDPQDQTSADPTNAAGNNEYVLFVTVTIGTGVAVTTTTYVVVVTVTDVDTEAPGVPDKPTVTAASATSVAAIWVAPANTGPEISDYDYRYRTHDPQGIWTEITDTDISTLTVTIGSLDEATEYDVQVRATNAEGTGGWSDSGTGSTAGLELSESSLDVAEGDSSTYTVALATQPTGEVTVTIGGTSGTDLSVDESSLTFTTSDWGTAQTVTVSAGEDDDASDDTATLTHTASGADYGMVSEDLAVTVTDDEAARLVIDPATLAVSEGASKGYTVALATQPTGEVTVTIGGTSGTDLSVDESSLTFTTSDWGTAQTVTVSAGEDDDADDDTATLTHTASGADYGSVSKDLAVTVTDDETAGLTLSAPTLTVSEGASKGYTVALATQPTGEVTVTVGGTAGTDLSVDESSLTFTTSDWGTAQTVTVSAGEDDDASDDTATLTHTASGADYGSVSEDLAVTVTDDDTVGLTLSAPTLTVSEGASKGYTVALATQPTGEVTVTIGGTSGTDLSVDESSLTFTTSDWGTAQTVTVSAGEDDDASDDTATLTHTASGADYGMVTQDLAVTVTDDDTAGLTLSAPTLTVSEGASKGYTVALATQPTGEVTVTIGGTSGTDLSVDESSLTFTTSDWGTAQTVTVSAGEDDDADDDTATLTHTASGGDYGSVSKDLAVTVTDDETAGLTLSAPTLTVSEGASKGYTVALATQPTGEVTVTIGGTAGTDLSVDESSLTFTTSDWGTAQTVTVSAGEDDDASDDTATLTHTASGADYGSVSEDLAVTVTDDDTAGLTLSAPTLTVSEGASKGYTVALATQPTGEVTVTIGGTSGTDLSVDESSLTFTTSDWGTAQTVTVSAGEDDDASDDTATLTHTASGGDYGSVSEDLAVTVTDDETAGLTLSAPTLTVSEGASKGYTVALATQPTGEVTVTVGGTAGTDLSVDESSLTFTTSDWGTAQTVTVSAGEDDDADDDTATLTHTASGADYGSVSEDLAVTVTDDDTAGLTLSAPTLTVSEGASKGYTVALATQPTGEVTVTIGGTSGTDLSVDESSLTFTTSDWGTAQTVTVSAGEDDDASDDTATLTHTASGADYGSVSKDLAVTVTDDEAARLVIDPATLAVSEGASKGYTVALATQPTGEVTVTIGGTSGTDLSVDESSLTFTTSDWGTAQTVTVSAGEDDDASDDTATLTHTASGADYGMVSEDLAVTVTDDETAGLTLSAPTLTVSEGASKGYTVALATQPTGEVTVTIGGTSGTDLSVDESSLTFTTSDWGTAQTVTVSAGEDDDASDDTATLTHTASGADYGIGEQGPGGDGDRRRDGGADAERPDVDGERRRQQGLHGGACHAADR